MKKAAEWFVHEDQDRLMLQIELGKGHTVTLAAWKDGAPSGATLWLYDNDHDFEDNTVHSFKLWLEGAIQA
jgi:hypothetical protein